MAQKLISIPIYILKNLRPHYLVGWLHRPEKVTRRPVAQEITEGKNKIVLGKGLVPKKRHLRLVAVDGKIIDPSFQ